MAKWKVNLQRTMFQNAGVEVEAVDDDEAYEKACKEADAKDLWENDQPNDGWPTILDIERTD